MITHWYSGWRAGYAPLPTRWAGVVIASLLSMLLACQAGAPVAVSNLVVVEVWNAVRVNEDGRDRYMVGGIPNRSETWRRDKPRWALPAVPTGAPERDDRGWPDEVVSGDLSVRGDLVVARRGQSGTDVTQVFNFVTGTLMAEFHIRARGVAWSRDGSTLAVIEETPTGQGDVPTGRVFLWKPNVGKIASWALPNLDFATPPEFADYNVFFADWSPDDRILAISVRKVVRNRMLPGCVVIDLETGARTFSSFSDVHFVGPRLLLGNSEGQVEKVWLLEAFPDGLKPIRRIHGSWFVAGADPATGKFLGWHPLPPLFIKAWTLPLMVHDLEDDAPVQWKTGGSIFSRFRMFDSETYQRAVQAARDRVPSASSPAAESSPASENESSRERRHSAQDGAGQADQP